MDTLETERPPDAPPNRKHSPAPRSRASRDRPARGPAHSASDESPVAAKQLVPRSRRNSLATNYRRNIEIGVAAALLLTIGLARAPIYEGDDSFEILMPEQEIVQFEEILQTKQIEKPPPPPRPPVPIEVADDAIIEDEVLQLDVTLDIDEPIANLPPPPPPPIVPEEEEEEFVEEIFVVVEQMPEIIGGTARLYQLLVYPDIARMAGMEGLVVVQIIVEKNGIPAEPAIARSAGDVLDRAAIDAVKQLQFTPGRQRGAAVRVRMAIPIRFRLKDQRNTGS